VLRIGPRLSALVVGAALAVVLAAGSVAVHRSERMVVGNMCETTRDNPFGYCYQQLPIGGWPLAFLFDDPTTSVRGQLGLVEDDFRPGWFLLDMAVFGVLPAAGAVVVGTRRRKAAQDSVRQSSS
jgi:hypothetical protein